jgi:hypothetical protein
MQNFVASEGNRIAYKIDDFTDPWRSAPTLLLHAAMGSSKHSACVGSLCARAPEIIRRSVPGSMVRQS